MKKQPLIFLQSLLLNLPYLALSLLLADQKYEISDDFIIDNVLSGAVGPDYASRAPYINRLLGEFLSFINRHTSDFSVFFYFQLAVSMLSFTALTYILLRRNRPAVGLCLSAVLLLFFSDDYYILVCCTRTASLAAAAGGALFLHAFFHPENEPLSLPELLSGGFLALIGSMIRTKSALLVLPFLLLLFIAMSGTVLRKSDSLKENQIPKNRPRIIKVLLPSLILLALAGGLCLTSETLNSQDPAYAAYRTFDDRRSAVVDTVSFGYESVKDTFDSLGLSQVDYLMLRAWNFNDREIFTDEVLDTVAKAQDKVRNETTLNPQILFEDSLAREYHAYACIPGFILIIAFYIYGRKHIPYAVLTLLLGAVLILVLEILGRPVYRAISAVLIAEAAALAAAPCIVEPEKEREPIRIRAAIFILIALMLLTKQFLRPQDRFWTYASDEEYRYWTEMTFNNSDVFGAGKYTFDISHRGPEPNLIAAIEADKEHYYLLDFTATIQKIFYNYPHTKRLPCDYYTDNYSYLGGVLTNFPSVNEDLLAHGLDPDALVRSVVNDNVLVVDNNLYEFRLLYLREHYFPNARMEQVDEIDGFKVWRYFEE